MNPFEEELSKRQAVNPFEAELQSRSSASESQNVYQSSIFPLRRNLDKPFDWSDPFNGAIEFDSDAGVVGSIKRAVNLPGEVMRGEVNPTSEEGIGRTLELGSLAAPIPPAMRNTTAGKVVFTRQPKVRPPTAEELKAAAKPVYDQLDTAGTEFSLKSVDDLSTAIQNELIQSKAIGEEMAPKTFSLLKKFQNAPQGSTSVPYATGLNAARKQLGRQGAKPDLINPDDPAAASYAARRIMEWFERSGDSSVVSGPSIPANLLKDANKNYAAAKRSELLTGKIDDAELKAAAANSGKNLGNAVRQRIAGLLTNKSAHKDRVGFTERELGALEGVVKGGPAANLTREAGNRLGGGGGGMSTILSLMGGSQFGTAGFAAPIIAGSASRSLSNALSKKALRKVDKATRERSPLFEAKKAATPPKKIIFDTQQAIAKAFLVQMLTEGSYSVPTDADLAVR